MGDEKTKLIFGVNDRVPVGQSIVLGLQHLLSMDLYVFPLLLASLVGLNFTDSTFLIQMCFFTCGIATLIQTFFCMKLPVVQGASFICLTALASIGAAKGMDVVAGSIIPGAIILVILGATGLFAKFVARCIPPYIGGLVIMIVGLSLSTTAVSGIASNDNKNLTGNLISGVVAAIVLLICTVIEYRTHNRLLSVFSVLISIIAGCIAAAFTGDISFASVGDAGWFQLPAFFHFGVPKFDAGSIAIVTFLYFLVLCETTGTWITVADVTGEQLTDKRYNSAVVGMGIGCLISSLFSGTPMTGYSSNAGVISITKIGSRQVIGVCGGLLMVLGLCPKIMAVLACIPGAVINGVFLIICQILIINGFKVVRQQRIDSRNGIVIGLSLAVTIGSMGISSDVLAMFPDFVQYFLSSGTAVGALVAVILNLALPSAEKIDNTLKAGTAEATVAVDAPVASK